MAVHGRVRDTLWDARRRVSLRTDWRDNLVTFAFADAIGELLVGSRHARRLGWLAVGRGDNSWDAAAPAPDRGRRALHDEMARLPLVPGSTLTYHPRLRQVRASARFGPGTATGSIRELGVIAGVASTRPASGTAVNHLVHDAIDKGPADTLVREVTFDLDEQWSSGLRDLIGGLLTGRSGLAGLRWFVAGSSDATPASPARRLAAETVRRPLDATSLRYDPARRAVDVAVHLGLGAGAPEIREFGVSGGGVAPTSPISEDVTGAPNTGTPDTGAANTGADDATTAPPEYLAARVTVSPIDRTRPVGLTARLTIPLVERGAVPVPDLAHRTIDEATAALRDAGLLLGDVGVVEADTPDARGRIVTQRPDAGTAVNEGRPIAVEIGVARRSVVPAVAGLSPTRARAALDAAGFVDGGTTTIPTHRSTAAVVGSEPPAGTARGVATRVTLLVEVPATIETPELRGLRPSTASLLLARAGLRLADGAPQMRPSDAEAGTVIDQSPGAAEPAAYGSAVAVVTASPVELPVTDLVGRPIDDLLAMLAADARFVLGRVTRSAADGPEGVVLSQAPTPPATAPPGTAIDVVVSEVATIQVPEVAHLDLVAADAAIAAAGGVRGAVIERVSAALDPGVVLASVPAAGARTASTTPIQLVVSTRRRLAVPSVVGVPEAVARESLAAAGLTLAVSAHVPDLHPGHVIDQDPAEGTMIERGAVVSVRVGLGVPNVLGLTVSDALARVAASGYQASVDEQADDGAIERVLRQTPKGGSGAAAGSTVQIVVGVSSTVETPNVIGSELGAAREELGRSELALGRIERVTGTPGDVVVQQAPAPGTALPRGSAVDLTVRIEPIHEVEVPDFVGEAWRDAVLAAGVVGLQLTETDPEVTSTVEPHIVLRQDPGAGAHVAPGSTVAVTLSAAEEIVGVPNLIRRELPEATELIERARLRVAADVPNDRGSLFMVVSQEPVADTAVRVGSTVHLGITPAVRLDSFVGRQARATSIGLERLGFEVKVTTRLMLGVDENTIVDQSPAAGTLVARGDLITLVTPRSLIVGPIDRLPIDTGLLHPDDPTLVGPIEPIGPQMVHPFDIGDVREPITDPITDVTGALGLSITDIIRLRLRDR